MGMPIRYNIRNLFRRKLRSFLTVLGIGLVIAIAVIMLAYSRGLLYSLRNGGDEQNAIVMSRRASDRGFSQVKQAQFDILAAELMDKVEMSQPGTVKGAEDPEADPMDSADLVTPYVNHSFLMQIEGHSDEVTRRGLVLGVDPERAFYMHTDFRLTDGRLLTYDDEQVAMVGALAWARLGLKKPDELGVGSVIRFSGLDWEVVGVFDTAGSGADGEIWVPYDELRTVLDRSSLDFIVVRANDEATMREVVDHVNESEKTELRALSEQDYYRGYSESFRTFALVGGVMALIITLGGIMVGMNTMYTAITGRIREIGMLQVQGFSKRSILTSFLLESLVIALIGGALGCALGSLVNGMPMEVTMGVFVFRVDGLVVGIGMALAALIGLVGAFIPAMRAIRIRMVEAMRYQ